MAIVGDGDGSREGLKREIRDEIRREDRHRRIRRWLFWLAVKLAVLATAVILAASLVARSGWYEVPLLSSWLYRPLEPIRIVVPLSGYGSEAVTGSALSRAEYDSASGDFAVDLTEQELTTLIAEAVTATADRSPVELRSVQATVDPEGIEVFAVAVRPKRDVTVRFLVAPRAENGKLILDITAVTVGSLDIPKVFVGLASKNLSGRLSEILPVGNGGLGELREIRSGEGRVVLVFHPKFNLPLK
ncbi:hypothetical protein JW899_03765 [Candidatus Uhrbacteria bacterium]|nr:hypothetical protein [Candidatus Uhrbacteria bacterium]